MGVPGNNRPIRGLLCYLGTYPPMAASRTNKTTKNLLLYNISNIRPIPELLEGACVYKKKNCKY